MIDTFDYKAFVIKMVKQVDELLPDDFSNENQNYVKKTMKNFALMAGEALSNDKEINLTQEQTTFILQVLLEWTFHKCIDLCNSTISEEYWDAIMQKIAFTIYEITKQSVSRNIPQEQLLEAVEHHVVKVYKESIEELQQKGIIDETTKENAENQSNLDTMANKVSVPKLDCYSIDDNQDKKYLKDKINIDFAQKLYYKYLLQAGKTLKQQKCNKRDRIRILRHIKTGADYLFSCIETSCVDFSKNQIDCLVTLSMYILFHRILVLYKNGIFVNNETSTSLIENLVGMIYNIECEYFKLKRETFESTYLYTIHFASIDLKKEVKTLLDSGIITKEQYNKTLDKSYVKYLDNEIERLKKNKSSILIRNIGYVFIAIFIMKVIIFIFRHCIS